MNTYRFEWDEMVTPELLAHVADMASTPIDVVSAERSVFARILAAAGGLPVVQGLPNQRERTAFGLELLHDAVRRVLSVAGLRRPARRSEGYALKRSQSGDLGSVISAINRVPLNRSNSATLATATGMTASLSDKVVEERRVHGAFSTVEDLDKRMRGIDARNRDRIAGAVLFDTPRELLTDQCAITNEFGADFRRLLALQDAETPAKRLTSTLELIAAICARNPHPATRARRVRTKPAPVPVPTIEAEWVGVLANKDYYAALLPILGDANQSIDVCMFHIAGSSETHPTRKLLDALIKARRRGVAVRVLMDRDRKTDPYLSTIINSPAKKYLEEGGVQVRFDTEPRLLHSKFVIVDRSTSIIGSHNWSAGSFADFDDLTLVISSTELTSTLLQRFTQLWDQFE